MCMKNLKLIHGKKIKEIADADQGENYWQVGDTKPVHINGKVGATMFDVVLDAFILGFNHNSALEGEHLIHFAIGKKDGELVGLVDSKYSVGTPDDIDEYFVMIPSDASNRGGWKSSSMRMKLLGGDVEPSQAKDGTLMKALPEDLRNILQPMTKYTDNTAYSSKEEMNVTESKDWLTLPAEYEVLATSSYANPYEWAKQKQYAYFAAGNPKIFHRHDDPKTPVIAWCRSPRRSYGWDFCFVNSNGSAGANYGFVSWAVVACFAA